MRIFLILYLTFLTLPLITFADAKYEPLVKIPGITDGGGDTFSAYVNFLYALSISVAALIAVVKIIIAGVKYMLTDIVTSKGEAIKEIKGALLGLLIILSAVLILETINPQLLKGGLKFEGLPPNPKQLPGFSVVTKPGVSSGTPVDEAFCKSKQGTYIPPSASFPDGVCWEPKIGTPTTPTSNSTQTPTQTTTTQPSAPTKTTTQTLTVEQMCKQKGWVYSPATSFNGYKENCTPPSKSSATTKAACDKLNGIWTPATLSKDGIAKCS